MASSVAAAKKRQEDAVKKQNGDIAPDVDQDGKMINPHNPDFITRVPWYLGNSGPTLKHHEVQKVDHFLSLKESDELVEAKLRTQQEIRERHSKTTFRKGACKNCGAMSHKEKDCVERPRSSKKAAWKTGLDIAPDEVSLKFEEHGKVSYSAKRDQWQGYDPTQYTSVVDRFERLEEERKRYKQEQKEQKRLEEEEKQIKKKAEKLATKAAKAQAAASGTGVIESSTKSGGVSKRADNEDGDDSEGNKSDASDDTGSDTDSDSDYDSDEDDDEEDDTRDFIEKDENAVDFQARLARQGGVGGAQMKVTARNLRIREDTPKYLRNLDLNSAHYDPKARSMRANPFPDENPDNLAFAGDNFIRYSGDALQLAQTQVLCWEMQEHGQNIDLISNPSQAELMRKQIVDKKKDLEDSKKTVILDKYGAELSKSLDPRLRLGQTEAYSEYSWDGRVVKGVGKFVPKSKYEEDIFLNNHTTVWGSFYNTAQQVWGYGCCHSLLKNSYCTGVEGRTANDAANSNIDSNQSRVMLEKRLTEKRKSSALASAGAVKRADIYGESTAADADLDAAALKAAMEREDEFQRRDASAEADDRRRGYNSMKSVEVTLEDMEAYRLKKQKRDDPMAAFVDTTEDI